MISGLIKYARRRMRLLSEMHMATDLRAVQRDMADRTPDNPAVHGWASYSQCDEDGIIQNCLERISRVCNLSRTFVEVGCGNGLENNTHHLVLMGDRGCWIDGNAKDIASIQTALQLGIDSRLLLLNEFLTRESISDVMARCVQHTGTRDIDFFSLDIDGNDLELTQQALKIVNPKLICLEYNAKFPPPLALKIEYVPEHSWDQSDYFGASLQAWVDMLDNYALVACNASGVNAFFVRRDLLQPFCIYPIRDLYQPMRLWLVGSRGHRPSMRWLRNSLGDRQLALQKASAS